MLDLRHHLNRRVDHQLFTGGGLTRLKLDEELSARLSRLRDQYVAVGVETDRAAAALACADGAEEQHRPLAGVVS